jgi:NAD(P)-dependent dehydrogenase (short-subunit alcohol dehydrogenase family)
MVRSPVPPPVARAVDAVLDATVVPGFSAIGARVRRRVGSWTPLDAYDLRGRTVLVTGVTSGIGRAGAHQLAADGARVILLGRDEARTDVVRHEIAAATGNDDLHVVVADMAEPEQVRSAVGAVRGLTDRLDAVLHNAGALLGQRTENSVGIETTVAAQVVGPFLMTSLLTDTLCAPGSRAPARVITMSSGGMFASRLTVSGLQMGADDYSGTEQYARAKRAQVTLNEMWAERLDPTGQRIVFHAVHPGWAATPGVTAALPTFDRVVRPVLRTPAEGADTAVWLMADDTEPTTSTGGFWHDRRRRGIHRLPTTRRSDTPDRRARLWEAVAGLAGVDPTA